MSRGDDNKTAKRAPKRRNPFRQKVLSPEEIAEKSSNKAARKAAPKKKGGDPLNLSEQQKLIDQLLKMDDFQEVIWKIMEEMTSSVNDCRARYINTVFSEAQSEAEIREVENYLGDPRKMMTLEAIADLLDTLANNPAHTSKNDIEALVCLNHFLLANWVRRQGEPVPYMLKEHANLRPPLDDIAHIDRLMKEAVQGVNQVIIQSADIDEAKRISAMIHFLQDSFVREAATIIDELSTNPHALD